MATDVAGRGIDIKDVSLIINYDMAKSIEGNYANSSGTCNDELRNGNIWLDVVRIVILTEAYLSASLM